MMTNQHPEQSAKGNRSKLKTALRAILVTFVLLVIVVGIAAYVLLAVSPVPESSNYELDLERVRQLAMEGEGSLPVRLNVLIVAEGRFPQAITVAGSGFQEQRMVMPSFQVVYEDSTVIIDTAYSKAEHDMMFANKPYDSDKFELLQSAMRESRYILATHEHVDHIAGIARSPYLDEISPKVILTTEQIANAGPETAFTPEMLEALTPLHYDQYHAFAPGLVLIKAAGHTPGSQMIYVRLQNGTEYLLVGDVVWHSKNLERLTGRPLLTSLMLKEDREMHRHQIRTLYDISQSETINLVISHDSDQIEEYIQQGLIGDGFE